MMCIKQVVSQKCKKEREREREREREERERERRERERKKSKQKFYVLWEFINLRNKSLLECFF